MTDVLRDARTLRAACDRLRAQGHALGFVPTMGALHSGHMSLLDAVRARGASRTVLSIFVNPLQFGANEDLARYPRPFEQDVALCEQHRVDLIYAPAPASMYPPGFQTHVEVEQLTQRFEGELRPTHFRGVTTVVAKLLNAVGPCLAAFGRKDYQQWRAIERMARDLDLPAEIIGCPIIREPDGLALSSRNRYLDPAQRARATAIYRGLCAAQEAFRTGERRAARLRECVEAPIRASFDALDYVQLASADDLCPCESPTVTGPTVVLVAARLGTTRLLDNAVLGEDVLS